MTLLRRRTLSTGASVIALAGVLAFSLWVPIPSFPDDGEAAVVRVVRERLPGWTVEDVDRSWEGAYTVVTTCAGRQMGFHYVPGHGLPQEAAWLRPNDGYAWERLAGISDHWRHLVWYPDPIIVDTHSCQEELAGGEETAVEASAYD
jgi:hypothetical protein